MSTPRTRVGYHNIKIILEDRPAQRALRLMLAEDLDILGLGEFGSGRHDILRSHGKLIVGKDRVTNVNDLALKVGMVWVRSSVGGPVVGLDAERFRIYNFKAIKLAEGRDVRDQPGTSGREPDNWATAVHALDLKTQRDTSILNFHFNAHVQGPRGYRFPDDPRADMHREEREMAGEWFRTELRDGCVPYMLGDTNWHKLDIPPANGTHDKRVIGTLGKRDIDSIYARRRPRDTYEVHTPSDHDGRVAIYG